VSDQARSLEVQRRILLSLGFGFVEPSAAPLRTNDASVIGGGVGGHQSFAAAGSLSQIAEGVRTCTRCNLQFSRENAVAGRGVPSARLMFINESPLPEDDLSGSPMSADGGQLLGRMIAAMGLNPEDVYSTLAVKCAALSFRLPLESELKSCRPWLREELAVLRPRIVVCFGIGALAALAPELAADGLARLRGRWLNVGGTAIRVTHSFSVMARVKERKRDVWLDLQEVMKRLNQPESAIPSPE